MPAPTLSSSVTEVTVFRRGAMVTRTATLRVGADGLPDAVCLEGLPLLIDDDSLRVELDPQTEGHAPHAGELRVTLTVPSPDPELSPPTDEELAAAGLEAARAHQARDDLMETRGRVTELVPGARGTPEDGAAPMVSPTSARLALLELRRERLERLHAAIAEADQWVRQSQERLETLQERARRASSARNPRTFEARKAVVVSLRPTDQPPASELRLRLRYFVAGARWAPSYVLRLDASGRTGTLELRALVGQVTGERWSEVALTLSTAYPQQWTELPELRSLRIGRRQPPETRTGWRPAPSGTEALYADYDRLHRPVVPPRPAPAPPRRPPASRRRPAAPSAQAQTESLSDSSAFGTNRSALAAAPRAAASSAGPGPAAPAAPAATPMAAPASRRAGLGSAIGGAIEGRLPGGGGGGTDRMASLKQEAAPSEEVRLDEPAAALTASRDQLEYGGLWMPPADDPRRGRLRRVDQAQRYGRLADLAPEQVAAALGRARAGRRRAQQLEQRRAPAGHQWAQAADGFDYAYPAEARVSLDSDGELHGLALRSPPVAATPRYICVPKQTPDVFRLVVLRNPIDAPLLPGPVDVYLGGRFALAAQLDLTPPRGRVELGLGVEPGIRVARNLAFDEGAAGLLKRHRDLEHRLRVEVRNNLTQPATVEVRERVPVTAEGEADIELEERAVDPPWNELPPQTHEQAPLRGGRVWTVEVPAGAERTLRATVRIRIPQGYELVGGNRRRG